MEKEVETALKLLKTEGYIRAFSPRVIIDGIAVDFVVGTARVQVVLECDGLRFHRVGGHRAGLIPGRDLIQDKIFHRAGFRVLHVLSDEWLSAADKVIWLRGELDKVSDLALPRS